jgi:hypothetical protein
MKLIMGMNISSPSAPLYPAFLKIFHQIEKRNSTTTSDRDGDYQPDIVCVHPHLPSLYPPLSRYYSIIFFLRAPQHTSIPRSGLSQRFSPFSRPFSRAGEEKAPRALDANRTAL